LEIIGNILADSWYFSRALIQKLLFSLKACFECKTAWQNDQLIGENSVTIDQEEFLWHCFIKFIYLLSGKK
jgi:hypothetical protein